MTIIFRRVYELFWNGAVLELRSVWFPANASYIDPSSNLIPNFMPLTDSL